MNYSIKLLNYQDFEKYKEDIEDAMGRRIDQTTEGNMIFAYPCSNGFSTMFLYILTVDTNLNGDIQDEFEAKSNLNAREGFRKIGKYIYICARKEINYFDDIQLYDLKRFSPLI